MTQHDSAPQTNHAAQRDGAAQRDDAMQCVDVSPVDGRARRVENVERVFCALLACDMAAAILWVGVPGALGHPLRVGNLQIGSEKWRLPLEIALLILVARRARKGAA